MKNYLILILALVGNNFASNAGSKLNASDIVIEGVILDSNLVNNPDFECTLAIYISEFPFPYIEMNALPHAKYEIPYKPTDTFSYRIANAPSSCYMYISYSRPTGSNNPFNWIDNIYMLEKGDSIFCELNSGYHAFSGKGAEKLQCQTELNMAKLLGDKYPTKLLGNKETFIAGTELLGRLLDSILLVQEEIIRKYENKLGENISSVMKANSIGMLYYGFLREAFSYRTSNPDIFKDFMRSPMLGKINSTGLNEMPTSSLTSAPVYGNYIFEQLRIRALENDHGQIEPSASESYKNRLFKSILDNYKGSLKDKLLVLFTIRYFRNGKPDFANIFDDILEVMEEPIYVDAIVKLTTLNQKEAPFKNYRFEDVNGDDVDIRFFKGKVVVLDFWYTGCSGCIKLKESMGQVFDRFNDNPKIEFVSVSVDRDREKWIKSVESGKYCEPNGVNLYTNGLGTNHEIITDNLIYAYPKLMILKDGKMFSFTPPRPSNSHPLQTAAFIHLLETAISAL